MKLIQVEHIPNTASDPYQELAISVIRQAADDYRSLGHKLALPLTMDEKKRTEDEMKSISRFFLGSWYVVLSGTDNGSEILEALDMEVFGND